MSGFRRKQFKTNKINCTWNWILSYLISTLLETKVEISRVFATSGYQKCYQVRNSADFRRYWSPCLNFMHYNSSDSCSISWVPLWINSYPNPVPSSTSLLKFKRKKKTNPRDRQFQKAYSQVSKRSIFMHLVRVAHQQQTDEVSIMWQVSWAFPLTNTVPLRR